MYIRFDGNCSLQQASKDSLGLPDRQESVDPQGSLERLGSPATKARGVKAVGQAAEEPPASADLRVRVDLQDHRERQDPEALLDPLDNL